MIIFDGFQLIIFAFIAICLILLLILRGILAVIEWKRQDFAFTNIKRLKVRQ